MLELDYFRAHPERSLPILREIFYDHFGAAKPNRAHEVLAAWQARGAGPDGRGGLLKVLITQNGDNPHHAAGSLKTLALARQRRCWKSDPAVLN
jgi:NAD-dependent deacetylase